MLVLKKKKISSSFRFWLRPALPCVILCYCVLPACEQIRTHSHSFFFFFPSPIAFHDRITNRSWWFSIPLGNWFSGVVTMWRWKTISKALNRCCNYLSRLRTSTRAHRCRGCALCDLPLTKREGQNPPEHLKGSSWQETSCTNQPRRGRNIETCSGYHRIDWVHPDSRFNPFQR